MLGDRRPGRQWRDRDDQRAGGVMLDPLAEVGIRVFVTVMVCRGQFMMDILRNGKRRECQQ